MLSDRRPHSRLPCSAPDAGGSHGACNTVASIATMPLLGAPAGRSAAAGPRHGSRTGHGLAQRARRFEVRRDRSTSELCRRVPGGVS